MASAIFFWQSGYAISANLISSWVAGPARCTCVCECGLGGAAGAGMLKLLESHRPGASRAVPERRMEAWLPSWLGMPSESLRRFLKGGAAGL